LTTSDVSGAIEVAKPEHVVLTQEDLTQEEKSARAGIALGQVRDGAAAHARKAGTPRRRHRDVKFNAAWPCHL